LYSLRYSPPRSPHSPHSPSDPEPTPTYGLRLLDASYCLNTTASGLAEAFRHFPALSYLDLTKTVPAKDASVLASLRNMPQLQILKLRGLGLRDNDIEVLADAIGCTIRSLDLRDNLLTDHTVRILLDRCFKNPKEAALIQQQMVSSITGDWPSNSGPRVGLELQDEYLGDCQDERIRHSLTTVFVSHLGIESVCGTGITHLYISGNRLTVEGISGLIRSRRLLVLDAGTLLTGPIRQPSSLLNNGNAKSVLMPGVQKLTPILDKYAKELRYLRINHAIMTVDAPMEDTDPKVAELEDSSIIVLPPHLVELDALDQAINEMPAPVAQELPPDNFPIAELEGSPVPALTESAEEEEARPAVHATLEEPRMPAVRRGSAFAPEVAELVSPILDSTGTLFSPMSPSGTIPLVSPLFQQAFGNPLQTTPTTAYPDTPNGMHLDIPEPSPIPRRTYSAVLDQHEVYIKHRLFQPHALLPSMLPNLQTLILTDVPPKSVSQDTATHITQFLTDCSQESYHSHLLSSITYALPPSLALRHDAQLRYARSLFALRQLVLEVASTPFTGAQEEARRNRSWRHSGGKGTIPDSWSSVEDPDCEAFWVAAKGDFSFFGEEECGQPGGFEGGVIPWAAPVTEKMLVESPDGEQEEEVLPRLLQPRPPPPLFDVLAEVARFRKEKKRLRELAVANGDGEAYVEGYWDGEIVVIRPGV